MTAIRMLAPSDPRLRPKALRLVADGGSQPVQRLTATFSEGVPDGGALVAVDIEVREVLDDDAFAAFRRELVHEEIGQQYRCDGAQRDRAGATENGENGPHHVRDA